MNLHRLTMGIVVLGLAWFCGAMPGYAEETVPFDVTVTINPNELTIAAGSGMVVLTADAPGTNLAYAWKLSGPGKIEGEGSAVFYRPPEQIEKIATAEILLTVTNSAKQIAKKTVRFTLIKKKTAMKTIALSIGAAAALGGGVALALGGNADDNQSSATKEPVCGGAKFADACWYLAAIGQSCAELCASHGGYSEATRTVAGSEGTDTNCVAVMDLVGAPPDRNSFDGNISDGAAGPCGCHITDADILPNRLRIVRWTTTAECGSGNPEAQRVCACNE